MDNDYYITDDSLPVTGHDVNDLLYVKHHHGIVSEKDRYRHKKRTPVARYRDLRGYNASRVEHEWVCE